LGVTVEPAAALAAEVLPSRVVAAASRAASTSNKKEKNQNNCKGHRAPSTELCAPSAEHRTFAGVLVLVLGLVLEVALLVEDGDCLFPAVEALVAVACVVALAAGALVGAPAAVCCLGGVWAVA
jgi:hypothetical protein